MCVDIACRHWFTHAGKGRSIFPRKPYVLMAYVLLADIVMAYTLMAYALMAYKLMAYALMAQVKAVQDSHANLMSKLLPNLKKKCDKKSER